MYNDPLLTEREVSALKRDWVPTVSWKNPVMAAKTSQFGSKNKIPLHVHGGAIDTERIAASQKTGVPLPVTALSLFWPVRTQQFAPE